ncbi:M15 family metallopeptidase [Myxacorys almedinensis]|uniref:D-alanyl-D-alanine dipeptidase n=1 Tax=Myxacorys almedinensis A TaxID=2690445 RepID=A0A8J7Z1G8_9CYAN|nr:M15 family metallopeptidase [Myxacorys almedinensis]NDJ18337.1 D-alanyl-D-alanine dipeptidase [Myxacorys almedinensis A]
MKPYQTVAIAECYEPLVEIPKDIFGFVTPHPYAKLGAPYGKKSPFYVRRGVCDRLLLAHTTLQQTHPGWKIQIFDAYRPVAVQQFMVDYTVAEVVRSRGLSLDQITEAQRAEIFQQVYQFWAMPNVDPQMPPPHSTGAAIDVTLMNAEGDVVNMGSPIDELSPRSFPNHFADSAHLSEKTYHHHRQLLCSIMVKSGFKRHWNEWWHFSYGDQVWAWLTMQEEGQEEGAIATNQPSENKLSKIAHYGRAA